MSSTRMKEEARRAELMTRSTLLKQQQALEDEEIRVRRKKEAFKLEFELAITDAKMKVYERFEGESNAQRQSNVTSNDKLQMDEWGVIREDPSCCQPAVIEEAVDKEDHPQERESQSMIPASRAEPVLSKLVQQQNEITLKMIDQQLKATLPPRKVNVFDGDPLQYHAFVKAFQQGIEDKTASNKDRLYFLEQLTSGEPNSLVRSCMYLHEGSYLKAKALLKSHFGNCQRVTVAYVNKALSWPNIPSEDASALNKYALFLYRVY